jgi:hypothetical protein
MAFNILDLFGPQAMNMLLQPAAGTQGVQNFLANPAQIDPGRFGGMDRLPAVGIDALRDRLSASPAAAQQEGFDPSRFGGGQGTVERLPAVGMDALIARLVGPVQAKGVASAGAGQSAQASAAIDPWEGKRESDVVSPDQWASMRQPSIDQTQTGAVPTQQAVQPARTQGLFGLGLDPDRKQFLQDMFLGWAAGSTPQQSLSLGAVQAVKGKSGRTNQNQTVQWLTGRGLDEQSAKLLASNPTALGDYLKNMNDPIQGLQAEKARLEIENLRNPNAKPTDDQREYQAAKDQGFEGTFMDYQVKMKEAGRSQINLDTGEKLPSGYRWVNPEDKTKGVQPIPGGPGEQIPGELAARVGMSESFAGQAPGLRERLKSGEMTGPIDSLMGQFGMGERGETYRQLQSGTDALMRLLTGAGMNESEARAYAERYLPTMKDNPDSAVGKLDQLMRELEAAKGMAMRGRGGSQPQAQPGGVVDYQEYFRGP